MTEYEMKALKESSDFQAWFYERSTKRRECFPDEEADEIAFNDTRYQFLEENKTLVKGNI